MSEAAAGAGPAGPGVLARVGVAALWAGGALAVTGGALVLAGPMMFRAGAMDFETATHGVQGWSLIAFGAGLALAGLAFLVGLLGRRQKVAIVAVGLAIACGSAVGKLFGETVIRGELPPVNDVQTDWSNPVAFSVATLRAREAADAAPVRDDARIESADARWSGKTYGEAQAGIYDLTSMVLPVTPAEAIVVAADAARRLGWSVMYSDPPAGQMEAVHHSFWFGLASDIAVRAVPATTADGGEGARIDVRSTSRLAGADAGANAQRVKSMLDEINFATRSRSGG